VNRGRPVKLVPVMVTLVPPAGEPEVGVTDVTVGVGVTVEEVWVPEEAEEVWMG